MKISTLQIISFLLGSIFFTSCKVEPQAIVYGNDVCNYCRMNIVQKTHSAQYVTKKGKQFKFDAVECLIHAIAKTDTSNIKFILVADYSNPGLMIDAHLATYLISPGIKSPMGANLTAISSKAIGEKLQLEFTGNLYTWEALLKKLRLN